MEVVETRELADDRAFIEGRPPTMLYVLSEAPEGHGALPNPRDTPAQVLETYDVKDGRFKRRAWMKEPRRYGAMRKSGQLEVWEYMVWVPWWT